MNVSYNLSLYYTMAFFNPFSVQYSDVALVEGTYKKDRKIQQALHRHCKRYFDDNYKGVFFATEENKQDIFQEAFITLWQNIEKKKIYVEDGELRGKDGKPFTGKLTSYFMSIAKLKYLEWVRKNTSPTCTDKDLTMLGSICKELLFEDGADEDEVKFSILEECISHMSERCSQILTLFYYEMKSLDRIMEEVPSFTSKDALKTTKYKCMQTLQDSANSIYDRYFVDA